jgi:hypothetical protein
LRRNQFWRRLELLLRRTCKNWKGDFRYCKKLFQGKFLNNTLGVSTYAQETYVQNEFTAQFFRRENEERIWILYCF